MTNGSNQTAQPKSGMQDAEVKLLAARAISVLASKSPAKTDALQRHLNVLCDAFVSTDEQPRHDAVLRLCQEGVAPRDVVAHIIPETARLMGKRWFENELSFAEVTIGSARLQETVRALLAKERREKVEPVATILLVVPRPEHHTLGIFVAADQFRRLGYDVHVSVGQHPRQIAERVRKHRYPLVGVTASGRRTLAAVRDLVETIRTFVPRITPVVVGGSVLDLNLDVRAVTGADHATSDPVKALELCGLPVVASRESEMEKAI